MRFANEAAATAFHALDQCSVEVRPAGRWCWECVLRNDANTPVTANLREGFLELAGPAKAIRDRSCALERALLESNTLAGGAKFALDAAGSSLYVRADIPLLEETQLLEQVCWAMAGFHCGPSGVESDGSPDADPRTSSSAMKELGELLRETSWQATERGPDEFSANLDADSAPPARIKANEQGLLFSVELARANVAAQVSRDALTEFLLSAGSIVRMARAHAADVDGQRSFGLEVRLPCTATAAEIDHALAALSVACRMCAREANVLLDETAARCYLAVRNVSTTHNHEHN